MLQRIENPELQEQIQMAADRFAKQKKHGLVFEEYLPDIVGAANGSRQTDWSH